MRGNNFRNKDIDPDEIFLDSSNLPSLDLQQFEGRLEKPISKFVFIFMAGSFFVVISVFLFKAWNIQVMNGGSYLERSISNSLKHIPVLPERGVIYDRNDDLLAWNKDEKRVYKEIDGISHAVGYLGYPSKEYLDNISVIGPKELVGKDGVEFSMNELLRGREGVKIVEVDAIGNVRSENMYSPGVRGADLRLSIDAGLSEKMFQIIKDIAVERKFSGGAGIIMDVNTGEIILMVSYPEYDPNILSSGKDPEKISEYVNDKKMPFLNRAISGVYIPGSILKPIFALGALNENIISPEKEIFSAGSISIPNPYFPDKPTVFKDWKAHGFVDMRQAIAVSSDVYFYAIGGGYDDQKGLGIANLEKYARMFGFGTTTGIELYSEMSGNIPSPLWKAENFAGEKWIVGNTYHSVIGQYGFQVTPIQAVRAIAAVANGGKILEPTIFKRAGAGNFSLIDIGEEKFKVVKEGMRMSVLEGTSQGLNFSNIEIAGKTGTAEIGISKKYVNSWSVGFFPYKDPKYAFAVVMENGPKENTIGGVYVMNQFFNWLIVNAPDYLKEE